jgi:hypothetical protein
LARRSGVTSRTANHDDGLGRSVSIYLPESREQIWSSEGSYTESWQVGDTVIFRNRSWNVTGRDEASNALTLILAPSG